LEQVQSDKCGKKKPVTAVKNRTRRDAEREAEKDEKSSYGVNPVCNDHRLVSCMLSGSGAVHPSPELEVWAKQCAHFLNKFQNTLVGNLVIDEIGIFAVVDDTLSA
jgi:hypothetical protein